MQIICIMKKFVSFCMNQPQLLVSLDDSGCLTTFTYFVKCRQANELPQYILFSNYNDQFYSCFGFQTVSELIRYLQTILIEKCRFESPKITVHNDVAMCVLAHSFFKHNRCRFGDQAKHYIDIQCSK